VSAVLAKLFTLAVLASIGYFTVKSYFAPIARPGSGRKIAPQREDEPEEMVACAGCGAYVSEQAAVGAEAQGRRLCFCTEACRDRWRTRAAP
jgi:hypothetical protein